MRAEPRSASAAARATGTTVFPILVAISLSHLLNDTLQSIIPALYPLVKEGFGLNLTQVGFITFTFQLTASLLQPAVGAFTDRRPQPFSLAAGMCFTLVGLVLLSVAGSYRVLLVSVGLVGLGSAVFHPESSRIANMAAGGRRGLAQSIFQVGGNFGSALGPLLAALILGVRGTARIPWFTPLPVAGFAILVWVGRWYRDRVAGSRARTLAARGEGAGLPRRRVVAAVAVLLVLIFSKYFYMAGMTSFLTFYLIERFGLTVQRAQLHLFLFQFSVAAGTLLGGPLGDRIGRKYVIWGSILGVAPFTIALPYAGLPLTTVLIVPIGIILASAFSSILVYAQELLPGSLGLVSGLFFGFAFGMGGIGSVVLGKLADLSNLQAVFKLSSYLPLLGLLAALLPDPETRRRLRAGG